jgi:hypothetical protein
MLKLRYRVVTPARGTTTIFVAVLILFIGAGCATPAVCVGGVGVCKSTQLPSRYVIIDPSGSQAGLVDRQVADVRAVAGRGPAEVTIVLLGERPSTSKIAVRVKLTKLDNTDPNAVVTRTALLAKLDAVVRKALAHRTNASDQFGALQVVHDDARQRGVEPGYEVFVLGDAEPCVPGVCWTHNVPTPTAAIRQVRAAYIALRFGGEKVTFVVGGGKGATRKSPAYVARLSVADLAVCRWAGAMACEAVTDLAEVTS